MEALPTLNYEAANNSRRPSHTFTIDTSRSNSNLPVVSLCAKMLGFQEGRLFAEILGIGVVLAANKYLMDLLA
ncbi:hypothetical protein ANCCAN_23714 [Ancylostoma caninum]|uniref:Uncharacterized protein n=1 Tax=Ancylostoma caninum TaxID=29170 RepID=A0A368FG17_ANCCA|nr:hypothetical protein ANCCAN_23714 [Ancylostoma caninum]